MRIEKNTIIAQNTCFKSQKPIKTEQISIDYDNKMVSLFLKDKFKFLNIDFLNKLKIKLSHKKFFLKYFSDGKKL